MRQPGTGSSRREFIRAVGLGGAGTIAVGGLTRLLGSSLAGPAAQAATTQLSLVATDGYMTVPGREDDPIYIFGFVPVNPALTISELIATYKGHTQTSAPTLDFKQEDDIKITLTNLGLIQRPDLTDAHTIHWHGFDVPSPLNDGVPEVSVGVPIGKQLTYFYRPHREGTYMYHCHFEDVEHVQMGMTGIVFVRPLQDGTPFTFGGKTLTKFAYNDGNGSTGYERHFAILLNEVWDGFHDGDRDIQESVATDYDPQWFTLNGRCYPFTTYLNDDQTTTSGISTVNANLGTDDKSQPNSALVQVNAGDRVLLRLANLGYLVHSMQLPGIPMHVIGQDASLLRNGSGPGAVDTSTFTNTLRIGPGEARDVLFDAPAYNPARPSGSDGVGPYNVYYFKNRDYRRLSNNGAPGPGGMMTEVRVYSAGVLDPQNFVSQTYG